MSKQFLRKTKISSRTCFLEILNLIPVSREILESICGLLKLYGDDFYYSNIEANKKFDIHTKFTKEESFILNNASAAYKYVDWKPTEAQVMQMTKEELKTQHVSGITYGHSTPDLRFMFKIG